MKKYAVIVAGGSGKRMGTHSPKQFLLLRGKPVIWHTLSLFLGVYVDLEIVLVLPEEHVATGRAIVDSMASNRIRTISGGETRFHSVKRGLGCIPKEEPAVVFVHDGVRCLLSADLVRHCLDETLQWGSAIPVVDCRDSVRLLPGENPEMGGTGAGSEALDRGRVKLVQTPQTFLSELILPAFEADYREGFTDEATVVEAFGAKVHLVRGEPNNIKITTPLDLIVAKEILAWAEPVVGGLGPGFGGKEG